MKIKKTLLLLVSLLVIAITTNSYAQGTWTQKTNFGGAARYWASGFTINGKVYIGLGYYPSPYTAFKDFWEYDPATNTWTQKANYPGGGSLYVTGFSIGSKGYFGCGWESGYKNDFWEYDPATNTWTQKAQFPGTARWGATGFSIGNKGYIGVGDALGNGTGCQNDFYEWDPILNMWSQRANFPGTAVYGAAGFSIGTKGYIGTGYDGVSVHNEFYEFDAPTNTWTQKANFGGAARYQDVGFSIGTKGYIGTGSHGGNDFWAWDQATNTWTVQAPFPGSAGNVCVGVSVGGKGYIGTGQTATKQFWEFTPPVCGTVAANITAGGPTAFCPGDSVILTATPAASYVWSNSKTTQSISVLAQGNYSVTITDAMGCSGASSATSVTVYALPLVTASASDSTICVGSSVILTGGGAVNYNWNNGVTNGVAFTPTLSSPTTYIVTGTDANNCQNTASVHITVNSLPTVMANTTSQAICFGNSVTLTGSGALSYIWDHGVTDGIAFYPVGPATYQVTATDSNGCTDTATVTVIVNPLPNVSLDLSSVDTLCVQGPNITLSGGTPTGGTYSGFAVAGIMFGPSLAGTGIHTITYTYTDTHNCTNSASANILVDLCTGLNLPDEDNKLAIYPNPAADHITLQVNAGLLGSTYQINDLCGRTLLQGLIQSQQTAIDISLLSKGVYLLSLRGPHPSIRKIIKQ